MKDFDEAAERAYCQSVAGNGFVYVTEEEIVELLLCERAAARAEVRVSERAEVCILRKDVADWKKRAQDAETEVRRLREELNAAKASLGLSKDTPVLKEHLRLDAMWQALVRERDGLKADRDRLAQELRIKGMLLDDLRNQIGHSRK